MISVIYSFNKVGYEAEFWTREIRAASNEDVCFIPFNHEPYLPVESYIRGQLLDNIYYERNPALERLYGDIKLLIAREQADALVVDNAPPYHPEFLRTLDVHKVLRTSDGPLSAYDRDFVYLHAYDQVLYHSPAYSRDLDMREKLRYCGARGCDLWPLGLFDAGYDPSVDEEALFSGRRDIDVIFVGAIHVGKMLLLAKVKKALGKRFVIRGLASVKKNLYFNARHGFPGWVRPLAFKDYVPFYQRAKIGINVHNRGKFTVGGYRLFELPANGVMQISDGGEYLSTFFEPGREIVGYDTADELIEKVEYYLRHDEERQAIARAGYRRAVRDHRMAVRLREGARLIAREITTARNVRAT
ncbi:MAG: glycosyltransferase family protein [Gemmatimonadaceae bacterium]